LKLESSKEGRQFIRGRERETERDFQQGKCGGVMPTIW